MTTRVNHRSIEILLIEDSPTDVLIAEEALQYTERLHRLHVVGNGVEAMSFLRQQAPYSAAPRPDLILLDLNLPKKDGREVLAEIKADQDLKYIPVVVLATLKDKQDVLKAYSNHANCYVVKPVDFDH
jgi:CheY-like chemotaxis protein